MQDDIYQPPNAELDGTSSQTSEHLQEFYVVSHKKFLTLYIATLGLYTIYWFYKNWTCYKEKHNGSMWPVMRGLFSIFFAHSLFRNVNLTIKQKTLQHHWSPSALATIYVLGTITSNVLDRMSMRGIGTPVTDFASLLLTAVVGYVLYQAQSAINLACNDANGESNADFTAANILWIILGLLLWALLIIGLAGIFLNIH